MSLMDEEWSILAGLLPSKWRDLAFETGAMQRAGGVVRSPEVLLQLLLLHVATGLSLKQATARAQLQNLAAITDVSLLKRLRSAEGWLQELARRMFEASRFANASAPLPLLEGRRLRVVDATTVQEPGATGTDWRVHYCIRLPELSCDFYELTDTRGAETYLRVPITQGDVILGDRGYAHREGVSHVLERGGDVIVRLNSTSFPLIVTDSDKPFELLTHLRALKGHQPDEWAVRFIASGQRRKARLCAIRKSELAATKAKKRIQRLASKHSQTCKPDTLEFAEYVFILATVERSVLDTKGVLDLYRGRWQIELCFKRLKSLLRLGHLPKRSDDSARAWIQGKLLTVLLIERLIDEARFFSPWGCVLVPSQPMARVHRGS